MNRSSSPVVAAGAPRATSPWGRLALRAAAGLSRDELVQRLSGTPRFPGAAWWQAQAWRWLVRRLSVAEVFTLIHAKNIWSSPETVSGGGSTLHETVALREQLPALLRRLQVRRLLDIPCGDFHWMSHVDLDGVDYLGGDIVDELVEANRQRHARPGVRFERLDLVAGRLPEADALLCRDCLVHLPNAMVARALANVRGSGARYLLATSFPARAANPDIEPGYWRPLNLQAPPFSLPRPVEVIHEGSSETEYDDKVLAVWRVADIPDPVF